jgi:hypothetical protein
MKLKLLLQSAISNQLEDSSIQDFGDNTIEDLLENNECAALWVVLILLKHVAISFF